MHYRRPLFALTVLCLAPAAYGEEPPLKLKLDRTFNVMPRGGDSAPAFLTARHMEGKKGNQLEAVGNAELRKEGRTIFADRLLYQQDTQKVYADGSVRIEQEGSTMAGPHLEFDLNSGVGEMTQPTFQLAENNSHGKADSLHIAGKQNFTLYNTSYTTCPAQSEDWLLNIGELNIDRSTNIGVAHGSRVDFMGVPILYTPWMDFPLTGGRKTGFLGPVIGNTTSGGGELTLPFYWNIAPNYDATIAPRVMFKRGTLLSNEFRYLEPSYYGEIHYDALPQDQLAKQTRVHQSLLHNQDLGNGFRSSINLNRVSDDAYFRDLSTTVAGTSQVNLLREGTLAYNGSWGNVLTRVQSFQTLQDPVQPVVTPYRRLPQVSVSAQQELEGGSKVAVAGEYVSFVHPTMVNGQRMVLYPSVSYPLLSDPGYYLTPKIGVHGTHYALGTNNVPAQPNSSRTVPIYSLDGGMIFERDAGLGERHLTQTLEPRAYYVYIPYRKQDTLPVFDTAQAPFSFPQMFTENRFSGNDRIGDANQMTLALTSRLLDAGGIERLKISVGERFNFETPRVYLVAPATSTSKSDILFGVSGKVTKALSLDGLLQYNPSQSFTEMYNYSVRYQPEPGKVFNLGYRFAHPNLIAGPSMRQIDISEQWQLYGRWGTVARWNYSFLDKRQLEALAGLEYNQACWSVQLVAQRITTATQQVSTGFFVLLNLNGLVGVGADPVEALRRSIPGYSRINANTSPETSLGLQ